MQSRQGTILQSLRGVQQFLDAHADKLGAVQATGARRRLDAEVDRLNQHAVSQEADKLGARGSTQGYYALRDILRTDHMAPIARIAALELPNVPELNPFRMPSNKLTAENLRAAAIGMVGAAEAHAAVFIDAGMPVDFADRLRAAADAMLAAIDRRRQQLSARRGATRGLRESVSTARKIVRVLDAFVRSELKNDAPLLAGWDSVRRPPSRAVRSANMVALAESATSATPELRLMRSGTEPVARAA
jgi:hypothetical protein